MKSSGMMIAGVDEWWAVQMSKTGEDGEEWEMSAKSNEQRWM